MKTRVVHVAKSLKTKYFPVFCLKLNILLKLGYGRICVWAGCAYIFSFNQL